MMAAGSEAVRTGSVIWITGLSGAGKTTVARKVQAILRARGVPALLLDGDAMREAMADPHYGYDRESRVAGAYRYARFAKMFAEQGFVAIVSTISLLHEVHDWNRAHLPGYVEVLIDVSESVRRGRDPKGLYKGHSQGVVESMGGVDLALEMPLSPHLRIANDGGPEMVDSVASAIAEHVLGGAR